jgi:hypothetical protein
MRWVALSVAVLINVFVLACVAVPFLITYAEVPPHDVSCALCAQPEVQRALARAAAIGRAEILQRVEFVFPAFISLELANIAFLIAFAAYHGRKRAA